MRSWLGTGSANSEFGKRSASCVQCLLHKPEGVGSIGRVELIERANKFARGQWADLVELCRSILRSRPGVTRSKDSTNGVQPETRKIWLRSKEDAERQRVIG